MSNKRKALGGCAGDEEWAVFPYKIASLERENRALKRQVEKDKAEIAKRYAYKTIETKDTLNRPGNRLVVEAEYWGDRCYFAIPDNVNLNDKTQVRDWDVHGDTLQIFYVGEEGTQEIEASTMWDADDTVKQICLCDIEDVGGIDVDEIYPDD